MPLDGRTALITGAGGALAAEIAASFAKLHANLVLLNRNAAKLDELVATLALPEGRVYARTVDLLDSAECTDCGMKAAAKFGHLDMLVHLAGGWTGGRSLMDSSPTELTQMLDQHVWTSINVVRAFVPYLVANRWGRVVMIGSPFAFRPIGKGGFYSAAKAGQEAIMLTLAEELHGTGVTANMLLVKTIDVNGEKLLNPGAKSASWTTPAEIAAAVIYLTTDDAGAVNGARIPLFGGAN